MREERNIRLIVAYDGTDLAGYQRQANALTVQECLEAALSKVCNESITIYGSSRTDAGVHAKFQVVTFFTRGSIPVENLCRALIAHLPKSIVVWSAEEVSLEWRARHHTAGKEYTYTIHNYAIENPLTMGQHWHVKKDLSLRAMMEAAQYLLGTHDFTSLKGANTTPADPVKTIYGIYITGSNQGQFKKSTKNDSLLQGVSHRISYAKHGLENRTIKIHVLGDGFLYHMVRNIAGLLVDVGLGKVAPQEIPYILEQKNRQLVGKTAPPQGLCLEEVFFTEERLQERIAELDRMNTTS